MTIVSIITVDPSNPTEVQGWLTANPAVVPQFMFVQNNIFYIVY